MNERHARPVGALHVVVARLRPDAPEAAVAEALALATALRAAPGVHAVLIGEPSPPPGDEPRTLIVATLLDGETALDRFAASEQHMQFAVRGLSAVTDGVWTAGARLDGELLAPAHPPADADLGGTPPPALWVCALADDASLFDWQARRLLDRLDALPGEVWCGPAIEDRDEHRLAAAALVPAALADDLAGAIADLHDADATLGPLLRSAHAPGARVLFP